jgi:hypothetical protein
MRINNYGSPHFAGKIYHQVALCLPSRTGVPPVFAARTVRHGAGQDTNFKGLFAEKFVSQRLGG